MLFTTHALVGEAIGVATGNPVLGFLGGVISHHLADWIPPFRRRQLLRWHAGPARYLSQME